MLSNKKLFLAVLLNLFALSCVPADKTNEKHDQTSKNKTLNQWLSSKRLKTANNSAHNIHPDLMQVKREEFSHENQLTSSTIPSSLLKLPKSNQKPNRRRKLNKFNFQINKFSNLKDAFSQFDQDDQIANNRIQEDQDESTANQSLSRGISQLNSIYNQLKMGQLIFGDERINTVRYVPSLKLHSQNSNKMNFMFNLSLLSSSESVVKAELYINKKHVRQRLQFNLHYFLNSNELLNLPNKTINETALSDKTLATMIELANMERAGSHSNSWRMFNIIDSIDSYANIRRNKIQFKSPRKTDSKSNIYYTMNDRDELFDKSGNLDDFFLIMEANTKFGNRLSKRAFQDLNLNPYLIVYSNEKDENMKNFFQSRVPNELFHLDSIDNNQVGLKLNSNLVSKDEFEQLRRFEQHVDEMNDKSSNDQIENHSSNKMLPEDPSFYTHNQNLDSNSVFSYNYLPKSEDLSSLILDKEDNRFKELKFVFKSNPNDVDLLKRNKRQITNGNLNKLPEDESYYWDLKNTNKNRAKQSENNCKTQSVTIDFQDISFSNWILEPKRFQSNYCSGACKFSRNNQQVNSHLSAVR
jgi:hypothetical protein